MMHRRTFLTRTGTLYVMGAGAATLLHPTAAMALPKSLQFLQENTATKPLSANQKQKLLNAVLEILHTHYGKGTLSIWNLPLKDIDFEKRLTNIIYWIDKARIEHRDIHYVDPIWILAQIMAESLFCEFAVSRALAGGICQFMPKTARSYDMLVAGDKQAHHRAPYLKHELANSLNDYYALIKQRSNYRKSTKSHYYFDLDIALNYLSKGKDGKSKAFKQQQRDADIKQLTQKIIKAKSDYVDYVEANIRDLGQNDLFANADFFKGFDERFTYKKPLMSMVHMMASGLKARNGNILAATSAYNAGLSRTRAYGSQYSPYGRVPGISETSLYVSRILVNYEQMAAIYYA